MNKKEITVQSAKEMQKVGKYLADEILKEILKNKKAIVIGLEGNLGSGKTTFIQGLAKGLKIKGKVTSSTFVIMKKYRFSKGELYHIDCYRIKSKDLLELDFKEIINQSGNIIVIEWAEKAKKILPKNTLWMKFEYLSEDKRKIIYGEINFN